jgi:hypothetical protein
MMRTRKLLAVMSVFAGTLVLAGQAFADPGGSKNSLTFPVQCGDRSMKFVVNSANGQGSGAQDQNTAPFTPALVVGTNEIFHPTTFDLTFTFTPSGGKPQSFTDTASRKNQTGDVTCSIDFSQTDPRGNTFAINGTVIGWIS